MAVWVFYRFHSHAFSPPASLKTVVCRLGFPLGVYSCEVAVPPEMWVGGAVEAWARLDLGQ